MVETIDLLIEVLKKYFRSRGKQIISLMKTAGQTEVRIELLGLRRYFEETNSYSKFDDLYRDIRDKYGDTIRYGESMIKLYDEYIVVSSDLIEKILNK